MILFAWSGFPQYAARCVGAFVRSLGGREEVMVVATRPKVPVEGMEQLCGCPVHWIDGNRHVECARRVRCLFVSGWGIPAFNELRDKVKADGGRVYAMVDNNFGVGFRNKCREFIKAVRFWLRFRSKYDGFLVPGGSGVRLLRFYGVPESRIKVGLYSADASLFKSTIPIEKRSKRILYVGQICERKNVVRLVDAFLRLAKSGEVAGWRLELYGCGPQEGLVREQISRFHAVSGQNNQMVTLHPFLQPENLAGIYGDSRIFILPSKDEHWGLVVHEAALSGCILAVSRQTGAAEDFVTPMNGVVFDAEASSEMMSAIRWAVGLDEALATVASEKSMEMGCRISIDRFVTSVSEWAG